MQRKGSIRKKRLPPIATQAKIELARQTTNEFRNPEESAHKSFHELRLTTNTFASPHAQDNEPSTPDHFNLLCYNGKPVGPTIRVRRGATFHIRVKNDLKDQYPNNPLVPKGQQTPSTPGKAEQPHDLCSTNLHTHGLHVSPANNADNIYPPIPQGGEATFEYTIGADHPSGTFWYHPHLHGAVAYQLSNGVAGALIVEGSHNDGIPDLEDIPEVAAAKERVMLLQLYNYRLGKNGTAWIDATAIYNVTPDEYCCKAIEVSDQDPKTPVTAQATAVNGIINPIIRIAPGEVQRWRLIHAAWDVNRRLRLVDDKKNAAGDLQFREIAVDGLATGTMVVKSNVDAEAEANLQIAPGQRSDVLIKAPLLNEGEQERTYHLVQSDQDKPQQENLYLAKIVVGGLPNPMNLPGQRDLAKCKPFVSIRDEELAKTPTFPKGLAFSANDDIDPKQPDPTKRKPHYMINNKTFLVYKQEPPIQIRLNTAEEWTIRAPAGDHPFHMHVNPFQVVMKYDSATKKSTPMNLWRDTLFVRNGEVYTIRSRFRDFLGQTVIHCHILDHEDQGMMVPIEFIPPYQTPNDPKAGKKANLEETSASVPALKLPQPNGTMRELSEFLRRNVILVFIQGVECSHCMNQLRQLVLAMRGTLGSSSELVAVSSQKVGEPAQALKLLGVTESDRFLLLVDEAHRAFRDFACYQGSPRHGLFLIDGAGVIRARYIGPAPFDDTQEVVRWARKLSMPDSR